MQAYTVRPVCSADIESFVEIERLCYPDPWSADLFGNELANGHSHGLTACDFNGMPIGYCFYWTIEDECEIHTITVHPGFRRKGIARMLLRTVLEDIARKHLRHVYLEVRKNNTAARALYASFGFHADWARKKYYSDGVDAVIMSRNVSSAE